MRFLISLILIHLVAASCNAQQIPLQEALAGWTDKAYDATSGVKNRTGELSNPGKLGCSGFFSIVYHRMKHGEKNWLKNFDFTIQQIYGDEAASKLGFKKIGSKGRQEWRDAGLEPGLYFFNVYFFNVRRGKAGHVGLIEVQKGGVWKQHHYSGLKKYNGYASGNFFEWFDESQYNHSPIEIFLVTF